MGRIYVPASEPGKGSEPEGSAVETGRIYLGSTDVDGTVVAPREVDETPTGVTVEGDPAEAVDVGVEETAATEPAGNASREEWAVYARAQGASEEDLVDADGRDLGRDALRDKYGSSSA